MYAVARQYSLEVFVYAFRHFIEALHNQNAEVRGGLLRLSMVLAHESAELAAKAITGRDRAKYEELFGHAFSHALGKPVYSEGKKTYFQEVYERGGLRACKDYRECLTYALTRRMLELTRLRNSLYHQGGHVVSLQIAYEFLRDVLAYLVSLYGYQAMLDALNKLPPPLRAWFLLSLRYFQAAEELLLSGKDLGKAWEESAKRLRDAVYEDPLRFMERLFEGDSYALGKASKALSALEPLNLYETLAVLKDRVLATKWYSVYASPEEVKQGVLRVSEYAEAAREVRVAVERWDGTSAIVNLVHEGYQFRGATGSDAAELSRLLQGAAKFLFKICVEGLPFKYVISALRTC